MPADEQAATYAQTAIDRLESLSIVLADHGWKTRLCTSPGRVPSLFVQNPEKGAEALTEEIFSGPSGGVWLFWWSWAEPVCADISEAAEIIGRVLRTAQPSPAPGVRLPARPDCHEANGQLRGLPSLDARPGQSPGSS